MQSEKETTPEPRRRAWLRWLAIGAGLLLLVWIGRMAGGYVQGFALWVQSLGAIGPLVFVVGYAIATVAFVPAFLLTLAAGAIFGLVWGTVYVWFAATLGACSAFLVARYAARSAIEKRIAGNKSFAAIDRVVGQQGLRIVTLLRLSPVFPFNLLNYALGLTSVRFSHYALASIAMLPGTLLYVYAGWLAGDLAGALSGEAEPAGPGRWIVATLGLLATAAVTFTVTRAARRALAEATGETADRPEVSEAP